MDFKYTLLPHPSMVHIYPINKELNRKIATIEGVGLVLLNEQIFRVLGILRAHLSI